MARNFSGDRSNVKAKVRPPKPPKRNFPLYCHALGYWAKRINGKVHYFGRWGRIVNGEMTLVAPDGAWEAALADYNAKREDLEAGRTPKDKTNSLTVKELCDRFYTEKKTVCDAGEMTAQSLADYDNTCKLIVSAFGRERLVEDLTPTDFARLRSEMVKKWGPVRLGNTIGRVRTVFKFAFDYKLIPHPMAFGAFKKPKLVVMRRNKREGGDKLFTADEVRRLIEAAGPQLKAMIYLGINAAMGNEDCATLPLSALDLDGGWAKYPRPKTEVDRKAPLWPETVEALRAVVGKSKDGRAFSMKCKRRANAVTRAFGRLLHNLHINGRRGLGFYSLRHTFRTIADAVHDRSAIRMVMGHTDGTIDENYTHGIDDARLRAVTDHVRSWLFAPSPEEKRRTRDGKEKTEGHAGHQAAEGHGGQTDQGHRS